MNPTFKLDTSRAFTEATNAFSVIMRKEPKEALFQQGRLFVLDAAKMTPPMGSPGDGAIKESFGAQRQVGMKRVEKDIRKGFPTLEDNDVLERIKNPKSRQDVKDYIQQGRYHAARTLLDRLHIRTTLVVKASTALHRQLRDSRGRVGRQRFLVLKKDGIKQLIKAKQKLVGLAKSGWTLSARSLGLILPKWISEQKGAGVWQDKTTVGGDKISIIVGNAVDFIQTTGQKEQIIARALHRRVESMKHQMEQALGKAFSGYKGGKYKR
jgi:hypothetical protein